MTAKEHLAFSQVKIKIDFRLSSAETIIPDWGVSLTNLVNAVKHNFF